MVVLPQPEGPTRAKVLPFLYNLGMKAYETITTEWNPDIAAERLVALSKQLISGEVHVDTLYNEGPCSRA